MIPSVKSDEAQGKRCKTRPDMRKIPQHINLSTHKALFETTTINESFQYIESMYYVVPRPQTSPLRPIASGTSHSAIPKSGKTKTNSNGGRTTSIITMKILKLYSGNINVFIRLEYKKLKTKARMSQAFN